MSNRYSNEDRGAPELPREERAKQAREPQLPERSQRPLTGVRAVEPLRKTLRPAIEMPTQPQPGPAGAPVRTQPMASGTLGAAPPPDVAPRGSLGDVATKLMFSGAPATPATPRAKAEPSLSPARTLAVGTSMLGSRAEPPTSTPASTPELADQFTRFMPQPAPVITTRAHLYPNLANDPMTVTLEMDSRNGTPPQVGLPVLGEALMGARDLSEPQRLLAAQPTHAGVAPPSPARGSEPAVKAQPRRRKSAPKRDGSGGGRLILLSLACILALGLMLVSFHAKRRGVDGVTAAKELWIVAQRALQERLPRIAKASQPVAEASMSKHALGRASEELPAPSSAREELAKAAAAAAPQPVTATEAAPPASTQPEEVEAGGSAREQNLVAAPHEAPTLAKQEPAAAAPRPQDQAAPDPAESDQAESDKQALFAQPKTAAALYIEGRYKEALAEYRMLATLHPGQSIYGDFARILRRRLVEMCIKTQPHRQAECSQL